MEVHVEALLPGETAEVEIEHRSPHQPLAWARIVSRIGDLSPDRVKPECPAYGSCGGCSLQHLSYPAQVEAKRRRVARELGIGDVTVAAAPAELGYRNKGKYVVGQIADKLVLGSYRPGTHEVIDTIGCQVVEPAIDAMAVRVRDALAGSSLAIYDERTRTGQLRYVVIRTGLDGEVLVAIVTTPPVGSGVSPTNDAGRARLARERRPASRAELDAIAARLPGAHGVVWVRNASTSGTVVTDDVVPLAGEPTVTEWVAGVAIEIGATEFFQVNRAQANLLYNEVAAQVGADSSRRAVDLYCGVGGISFALASVGARVIGIERQSAAVSAANAAAARANLSDRVQFVAGTGKSLRGFDDPAPHIVVVNPPRKGLDPETRSALESVAPEIIAYVSCSPESLARDMRDLVDYQLESATAFDLMPGTPHIETLAILRRRPAKDT